MPIIIILIFLALGSDFFVANIRTSNFFLSELSKLLIVAFLKLISLLFASSFYQTIYWGFIKN